MAEEKNMDAQNNEQNPQNEDQPAENTAETQNAAANVQGQTADFPEFDESTKKSLFDDNKLEFLQDLKLNVYIELGRTKMPIKDILQLERGYVIELEKLASEPVDIYVNNKKIAEGEVVVIDKHFGIRITNLIEAKERFEGLKA
jgi:flagellar motor switch protein FliN/FliY